MKKILFLLAMLVITSSVHAQRNRYKANIILINGKSTKGYLNALTDSALTITNRVTTEIKVSEIRKIKMRHRSSLWKGTVIGTATGAVLGGVIGYSTYEEPDCAGFCIDFGPEGDAMAGAVLGAGVGALLGLAIGANSKDFLINGNVSSYKQHIPMLQTYVYPR
jgi:uncharacterized protein YcfJ